MTYTDFKKSCIRRGDCAEQTNGMCPGVRCLLFDDLEMDCREEKVENKDNE